MSCTSCVGWRMLMEKGSPEFVEALWKWAEERGYTPTHERLLSKGGTTIATPTAKDIFMLLGLENTPPEEWLTKDGVRGKELEMFFDRVVCVNLKRRKDRWEEFQDEIDDAKWPFRTPIRFEAVDGHAVPCPHGWRAGGGTWGCMQSHRQVLERAIQEGVKTLLVLEDDASFVRGFSPQVKEFLSKVPSDWDGLMLGGQHCAPSVPVGVPGVVRCMNAQRTHAYAVRGGYMKALYQEWCSRAGHCDHIMGPMHAKWKVYAPDPFLVAQGAGKSDISGREDHRRLWSGRESITCAVLQFEEGVDQRKKVEELRGDGLHIGYWRDEATGYDKGVREAFERSPGSMLSAKLKIWWGHVRWEAAAIDLGVPALWHPAAVSRLQQVVDAVAPDSCVLVEVGEKTTMDDIREQL